MVHGDIRSCNLLFGEKNSWIIDFDMASPEVTTKYSDRYNHKDINERHSGAKACRPMYKVHDRFSLAKLMEKCDDHSLYLHIIEDIKNGQTQLDVLAQKLEGQC